MKNLINPIIDLAENAGKIILEIYLSGFSVKIKSDKSPLTQADLAAHSHIVNGLSKLDPNIPIISEEEARKDADVFVILPYGFTEEFIIREREWVMNGGTLVSPLPELRVITKDYYDS